MSISKNMNKIRVLKEKKIEGKYDLFNGMQKKCTRKDNTKAMEILIWIKRMKPKFAFAV